MKKIISVLVALIILAFSVPVVYSATSNEYSYTVISETEKTCKISEYSGTSKNVVVPSEIDGYKVVALDRFTFYKDNALTVQLPETVSYADGYSFNGLNSTVNYITVVDSNPYLSSIDGVLYNKERTEVVCFPAGRTEISYTIPEGVTAVNDYAFYNSSLKEIILPNSLNTISQFAFSSCTLLKSIEIPKNVVSIEASAFRNCKALETVTMTDSVTSLGVAAFYNCNSMKSIRLSDNITTINASTFIDCNSLEQINFPSSLTMICHQAFFDCDSLVEVNIPDSVTIMEYQVFNSCDNLKKVLLSENIAELPGSLFTRCNKLEYVYIPNSVISAESNVFNNCPSVTIYGYSGSYGETYASEQQIPFVALDNVNSFTISDISPQIRFRRNEDGSYAGNFDVRSRVAISDEDFKEFVGVTNEEAIHNIKKVGFIYSINPNSFLEETAQQVAKGDKLTGYTDVPVNYIQDADGYYMFTCLVTDIPAEETDEVLVSYAYICVEIDGEEIWYFSEDQSEVDFYTLYSTYYPKACEKYGWEI